MAYDIDFIKRAVAYKQDGHTFQQLREVFDIPPETYYQWVNNLETGYYEIEKGKQERKRKIDREQLRNAVANKPDAYLYELAGLFDCSAQAIFYMLAKLNITLKKRPSPIVKNLK
jgi:transposase